jgi:hypothetical protein
VPALLVAIPQLLHAQPTEIGLKLGPALSHWASAYGLDRPSLGFVVGVYSPTPINPRLVVQPELLFSLMGTLRPRKDDDEQDVRAGYLRLPVSLRYKVGGRLELGGGLEPGLLLKARLKDRSGTQDITSSMTRFDMALLLGCSYKPNAVTDISIRYVYGMSHVLRDEHVEYPYNRAVQFTIGHRIHRLKGGTGFRRRCFTRH